MEPNKLFSFSLPLALITLVIIMMPITSSQIALRAGGQNDPFKPAWSDEYSNFGSKQSSSSSSSSSSRRPPTGPGSRDMGDVCSRRCRCTGDRLEIVYCSHIEDFGSIQDEFSCPNRIENLTLYNVTFKASRAGFPVRLDANNFTDFRQLVSLRIINSTHVNIINYSAFLPSRNRLKHIEIVNSKVQRIESGAFAYLDLDTLDLSHNRLYYHQKISPGTFQDARAIRTLILRNTSLSALPTSVIAPIAASLTALDISYNRLHTLSSDLIPVFCQLSRLAMNNNTWCCAKPGRWLSLFLRLTLDQLPDKIVGSFPPTCEGGPRPLKGRALSDVSYEEMDNYETCEGLLGPKDPKTCQELLAKFHEMFAIEHSTTPSLYHPPLNRQQMQQNIQQLSIGHSRTDRFQNRQRTTTSTQYPVDNRRNSDLLMSSPSGWQRNPLRVATSTAVPAAFDNYDDGGSDDNGQLFIAGGTKMQMPRDDDLVYPKMHQQDDEESPPIDEAEDLEHDEQQQYYTTESWRRRGALAASTPLSCGFVECSYIVYAVIGTVGFVALVGAGIGIYTLVIRRWRNRSRTHLVERITS